METTLTAKLVSLSKLALDVDTGLWTDRYSPETRPTAEAAKTKLVERCERIRRVLRLRYGVEVTGRATEM